MRKLILLLCLLAGVARAATDKVPLTVSTNGQIEAPTNFWAAQITNARFVTAVQAVSTNQLASLTTASNALVTRVTDATNDLWSHTLTASNAAVLAASNAAYTAAAAVTVAATNGLWANSLTLSNGGVLSASNAAYTAASTLNLATSNSYWAIHLVVSNATFWASSNAAYAAASAYTVSATQALAYVANPPALITPVLVLGKAPAEVWAYARHVQAAGGPNLATNGEGARLAAALDLAYRQADVESNLVDAFWCGAGQTTLTGTNVPTLRGRYAGATAVTYSDAGLFFNGTNSVVNLLGLPDLRTNTICIRIGTDTNYPSSSYAFAYAVVHTNGYTSSMANSMAWSSAMFYLHTYGTNYDIGEAVFARNQGSTWTEGYSEGFARGQRQMRDVIVSVGPSAVTNLNAGISWVDGILGQHDTNVVSPTNACNRLVLGMRPDAGGGYSNPLRGFIQQAWIFDTVLSSNQQFWVEKAMSLAAGEVPFIVQGDSISEFSITTGWQGIEWPQQMWWGLGALTNTLTVHNHAYSGRTVAVLSNEMNEIIWTRRGSLLQPAGYYALMGGINDIIGGAYATNIFRNLSNMWVRARTNGLTVIASTILPMGTNNGNYTAGRVAEISTLNALIRGATNNPIRPFDYLLNADQAIINASHTNQLYDGLHPTPEYKRNIGLMLATNAAQWLR